MLLEVGHQQNRQQAPASKYTIGLHTSLVAPRAHNRQQKQQQMKPMPTMKLSTQLTLQQQSTQNMPSPLLTMQNWLYTQDPVSVEHAQAVIGQSTVTITPSSSFSMFCELETKVRWPSQQDSKPCELPPMRVNSDMNLAVVQYTVPDCPSDEMRQLRQLVFWSSSWQSNRTWLEQQCDIDRGTSWYCCGSPLTGLSQYSKKNCLVSLPCTTTAKFPKKSMLIAIRMSVTRTVTCLRPGISYTSMSPSLGQANARYLSPIEMSPMMAPCLPQMVVTKSIEMLKVLTTSSQMLTRLLESNTARQALSILLPYLLQTSFWGPAWLQGRSQGQMCSQATQWLILLSLVMKMALLLTLQLTMPLMGVPDIVYCTLEYEHAAECSMTIMTATLRRSAGMRQDLQVDSIIFYQLPLYPQQEQAVQQIQQPPSLQ